MRRALAIAFAAAASTAAWIGFVFARSAFRHWGIVEADAAKTLPGDELVPEASAVDTRTIEIDAPPARIWPWLVQMGYGRAGWYSYDQLDMDHPSADHVIPELQSLAVGDVVPTHPTGGFEVKVLEPDHALVLFIDRATVEHQEASARVASSEAPEAVTTTASPNVRATGAYLQAAVPGDFSASWAFVLEPLGTERTRLVERFRARLVPPESRPALPPIATTMLGFGVFVMTRRQMLGIKARAEGTPDAGPFRLRRQTPKVQPAAA